MLAPTWAYDFTMSISVSLEQLRAEMQKFPAMPYLLTVSEGDRPHCVAIAVTWDGDQLVMAPGNSTLANAAARPSVSILWPPSEAGGYSLIVDASVTATSGGGAGDNSISVLPTRAVLHRPAGTTEPEAAGCGADCVSILRT